MEFTRQPRGHQALASRKGKFSRFALSVTPWIEDPSSKANRANLQQKNPMLIEFQHRSSSFLPPRFFEAGLDPFGGMTVILLGDASRF